MAYEKRVEKMAKDAETKLPFLNIKRPTEDGKRFGYRIKKLAEAREVPIKKGKYPGIATMVNVELIKTTDPDYQPGKFTISTRHTMLKQKLTDMDVDAIADLVMVRKVGQWWQYAFENVKNTAQAFRLPNLAW